VTTHTLRALAGLVGHSVMVEGVRLVVMGGFLWLVRPCFCLHIHNKGFVGQCQAFWPFLIIH
jgi:hypothetical protein